MAYTQAGRRFSMSSALWEYSGAWFGLRSSPAPRTSACIQTSHVLHKCDHFHRHPTISEEEHTYITDSILSAQTNEKVDKLA